MVSSRRSDSVRTDDADGPIAEWPGQGSLHGELAANDPVNVCLHAENPFLQVRRADHVLHVSPVYCALHLQNRLYRRESNADPGNFQHIEFTCCSQMDAVRRVLNFNTRYSKFICPLWSYVKEDTLWSRIYRSIIHYFQSDFRFISESLNNLILTSFKSGNIYVHNKSEIIINFYI